MEKPLVVSQVLIWIKAAPEPQTEGARGASESRVGGACRSARLRPCGLKLASRPVAPATQRLPSA